MYIRMSTDHQKYSPENQRDEMGAYAAHKGMPVVGVYAWYSLTRRPTAGELSTGGVSVRAIVLDASVR
jgi:hypothetical protein